MKLSILMPVYNEQAPRRRGQAGVLTVSYPCEIELVIVDDGSRDGTVDVLASLDDPRINLQITAQPEEGRRHRGPRPRRRPVTTWSFSTPTGVRPARHPQLLEVVARRSGHSRLLAVELGVTARTRSGT